MTVTDKDNLELFEQFKGPDTTTGAVRSHAHRWSGPEAIAAAVSSMFQDERPVRETLVIADHPKHGDKEYKRYGISRQQGNSGEGLFYLDETGDHLLEFLDFGDAQAAAKLAFVIGLDLATIKAKSPRPLSISVYRQPTPTKCIECKKEIETKNLSGVRRCPPCSRKWARR